ncbi:MAG: peptide chain release factor N(5)-glutamine methyltransferase [Bacteroidaceae bacterium]|nr:peptide chain release factor N(5)-glutamine methyltransferase [Bacteroidaceae bacterium]MBO7112206.1 peptide chain release factor N(5)-glutamine methyltransferase [Bacteroidaceae bacterium]
MKRLLSRIDDALGRRYDAQELETIKRALCTELLGVSALAFYTKETLPANPERDSVLESALERLAKGEPLQYVIGSTPFCGLTIRVDSRVLIPRPETAELVEWVAQDADSKGSLLDVGTGSGCIAISLAHRLLGWKVQGWDISDGALEVARENNRLNGTEVELRKVDILNADSDCRFDVIVSNPPYVLDSEKGQMEDTVLDYEPHLALFVSDSDPLLFYRAIAAFGHRTLNPGGRLYFEINPLKVEEMKDMLMGAGYRDVEVRNDIFGKPRMIKTIL